MLSHVTGQEYDQICRFLLGLVIDIHLPGNSMSNSCLVRSVHALLDFLYITQYPIHTETTLKLLKDVLSHFHDNKNVFVDLGIHNHFNIPKLHFATHYVKLIKLFGTTDNFNTQYTKCLHIDLAKDTYRATNRKDEFEQMTTWLDRKERILQWHTQYVNWHLAGSPKPKCIDWIPPGLDMTHELSLAKHPSMCSMPLQTIENRYSACFFTIALCRFISSSNKPNQS